MVLEEGASAPDADIDRFIDSTVVSIRYCFVTQLLGKVADMSRSLLQLQSRKDLNESGSWDPRSFATKVIVPWVADNHNILGTSREPYASKPLRRPKLFRDMGNVKKLEDWNALVAFFEEIDQLEEEVIRDVFRRCLRSLSRRLSRQNFEYPVPRRVSTARLFTILDDFLGVASQGLRPLVVAAALMRVLGKAFSLYSEVHAQGLNTSDESSQMPGDIMCYSETGRIVLVVEVKDRALQLADLRSSISKARKSQEHLWSLLFAVPSVSSIDGMEIQTKIEAEWASGLNIYHLDVISLARSSFAILDEKWRVQFLLEIGKELDTRGEHSHRESWRSLLS